MIYKVIDGINDSLYNALSACLIVLGAYSTFEILFNMDIPFLVSIPLIAFVFICSYFATDEDPKVDAVPIMIIKDGRPANVDNLVGDK